jgi:hypothetical protein
MTKRTGIQGVQGSYNSQASVRELDISGRQWVEEMYQYLRYNETEMDRWKSFLTKDSSK